MYVSALGGLPLFSSDAKFESHTGWPSFYEPLDKDHVVERVDTSIAFMPRVEVSHRREFSPMESAQIFRAMGVMTCVVACVDTPNGYAQWS